MNSYDFPDRIANRYGDMILISNRTCVVRHQANSPRVNGKLQLRANPLNFYKTIDRHVVMNGFANDSYNNSNSSANFTSGYFSTSDESQVFERARSIAIINAQNAFLDEVSGIRVNLYDLYRTRVEAANMVSKTANKLVSAYRHLKAGRWRQFCSTLGISAKKPKRGQDNIPALWVEYQYGWSPLLSDLHKMLSETFSVPGAHVRKVYRMREPIFGSYSSGNTHVTWTGALKYRATAQGYVYVDAPAMLALSQYGVTNPAAVAWEALPFSFIVDWFVPVGDFINSMNATGGLLFKDYSVTTTIEQDVRVNATVKFSVWDSWDQAGSGSSTYYTKSKRRQTNDRPQWSYPGPSGVMDQSLTRMSIALSLVALIFGGK